MKWISLPTYILYRLALPIFRADHPWRNRPAFTLAEWRRGSTDLNKQFNLFLWVSGACLLLNIGVLVYQLHGDTDATDHPAPQTVEPAELDSDHLVPEGTRRETPQEGQPADAA